MKRVLVTGAAGFVGANLARRLIKEGHDVHLLVRSDTNEFRLSNLTGESIKHTADLRDAERIKSIVRNVRPEWIFHLAMHGAYSWQTSAPDMVQSNIVGTTNLLHAAIEIGFDAFVNTGSSSEYGLQEHPVKEDELLAPNSYYAVTKAAATMYCRFAAQHHRLHIPTLRLYSVFGPFEEPRRFIPTLVSHALEKTLPPLVDPMVARDFVYVDDMVEAYLLAAQRRSTDYGAIYNVSSGQQTRIQDVIATARKVFEIETEPSWGSMANRAWDTTTWVGDNEKIKRELGFSIKTSLGEGLQATARWLHDTPGMLNYYRSRQPLNISTIRASNMSASSTHDGVREGRRSGGVSIILPVGNQEDHIAVIVEAYIGALHECCENYELILITNGIVDRSAEICQSLSRKHPQVMHIDTREKGWGLAVRLGLKECHGELICYTNSARTSAELLCNCLSYALANPQVIVKANRKIRDNLLRRLGSLIYNLECRALFDLACWDVNGTPKVFPRAFGELLQLKRDDDLIDAEFLAICKAKRYPIIEVPTLTAKRHGGKSTTNYSSAFKMYTGAIEVWWQMAKNQAP